MIHRSSLYVFITSMALMSCGPSNSSTNSSSGSGTTPDEEQPVDTITLRRDTLTNVADQIIVTQYDDFSTKAEALEQTTRAWSEEPANTTKREAAQQAWREAMTSWQYAEVFQLGPAGVMSEVAGGEDLRNLIYSWPLVNACRVDQELAKNEFVESGFFAEQLVNVRGLDAVEYVLFYDETRNSCAPTSSVNSNGSWTAIEDVTARRANFAHIAAQDINSQAKSLVKAWQEAGQNFRAEFVNAGTTSQTYSSTQEALNALSDAMFYLEKETKDMKLAVPAGLSKCADMTCPEALEHPYADFALEASLANHKAFQKLYLGNAPGEPEAKGFDDLLIDLGQTELDAEIKRLINEAIAAHDAIEGTLSEALENDLPKVIALYEASQALGRVLKTQFVGVLDLEIPQRAEGDND